MKIFFVLTLILISCAITPYEEPIRENYEDIREIESKIIEYEQKVAELNNSEKKDTTQISQYQSAIYRLEKAKSAIQSKNDYLRQNGYQQICNDGLYRNMSFCNQRYGP